MSCTQKKLEFKGASFFRSLLTDFMKIINQTKQAVLASRGEKADTAFSRLKGLLGRSGIEPGQGMVITQCRSIHMLFMKFAIDVVFVDRNNIVVGIVKNIKPFQLSPYFFRAAAAIELPVGTIGATQTKKGDEIKLINE